MGKTFSTGLLTNGIWQDSSNNIGIGGAANASYKLQVTGTTNLTGALSGTSATFSSSLRVGGATGNFIIDSYTTSKIGVRSWTDIAGTTNNFFVQNSANYNYGVIGVVSATGGATGDVYALGYTASAGTSMTPVLNWTSGGNVGIGTSSLSYMLDILSTQSYALRVYQNINSDNYVRIDNTSTGTSATSRVDIGVNANSYALTIQKFGLNYYGTLFGSSCTNSSAIYDNSASSNGLFIGAVTSTPIIFGTSNTERMRITSGGDVGVGKTGGVTGLDVYFANTDSINSRSGQASGPSRSLYTGWHSASATTSGTLSFNVVTNGNVTNTNGSYGTLSSDRRLKENIVSATPKLDDIMKLNVVNFNLIGNEEKHIGFIAQEMQEVFPSFVHQNDTRQYDEEGNVISGLEDALGVKVGMEFAILVKAIQELSAKVTALENK